MSSRCRQIAILIALSIAILSVAATPALAQRGRSSLFSRSQNSLVSLAANEAVQKDLGCSADEVQKLREFQDEYREQLFSELGKLGISFQNLRGLTDEQRTTAQRNMDLATERLNTSYQPKLKDVLVADQLHRLRQIQLQVAALDAILEVEVVLQLELSAEQRQQLDTLRDEYGGQMQELVRGDGDQGERMAKYRELANERDQKVAAVLTTEQRERYFALLGEPFDVTQVRFGRRGF